MKAACSLCRKEWAPVERLERRQYVENGDGGVQCKDIDECKARAAKKVTKACRFCGKPWQIDSHQSRQRRGYVVDGDEVSCKDKPSCRMRVFREERNFGHYGVHPEEWYLRFIDTPQRGADGKIERGWRRLPSLSAVENAVYHGLLLHQVCWPTGTPYAAEINAERTDVVYSDGEPKQLTQEKLAEEIGIAQPHVSAAIKRLTRLRLVSVDQFGRIDAHSKPPQFSIEERQELCEADIADEYDLPPGIASKLDARAELVPEEINDAVEACRQSWREHLNLLQEHRAKLKAVWDAELDRLDEAIIARGGTPPRRKKRTPMTPTPAAAVSSQLAAQDTKAPSQAEVTEVGAAVRRYVGAFDNFSAAKLIEFCRQKAPDATSAEVVHFVDVKGPRAKETGFFFVAVPPCFDRDSLADLRRRSEAAAREEAARAADEQERQSAHIMTWSEAASDPLTPDEDRELLAELLRENGVCPPPVRPDDPDELVLFDFMEALIGRYKHLDFSKGIEGLDRKDRRQRLAVRRVVEVIQRDVSGFRAYVDQYLTGKDVNALAYDLPRFRSMPYGPRILGVLVALAEKFVGRPRAMEAGVLE